VPPLIFRKGLDMKEAVAAELAAEYHSGLVQQIREAGFVHQAGRLTIHLAREFGFCYGVDRAVDYAYQARRRFPDRNVFLTGEIIHNPHVNDRLRAAGIRFLSDADEIPRAITAEDVVIIPAFGVTIAEMERLTNAGCTLVDTTCGSVLNVWKNVRRYAHDDFTSIIHGKIKHEETRATASQAQRNGDGGGHYLVVLDPEQAAVVCEYIRHGGDRAAFLARFGEAASPRFDPDVHLQHIGCANQTTMLMSESLEIERMLREAIRDRYGEEELATRFRAFDTICSATQERQDAVLALLAEHRMDLMIVIGGYNSSNTCNLARMCAEHTRTFHISDPECLVSAREVRFRPVGQPSTGAVREETALDWLPDGDVAIGLTAGASTPNNIIGEVIERLSAFATAGASSG
jgi:4-hydroxy-3-methylbut-2-enyl diphosphate reductase